jgi:hypothetical protein
MLTLSALFLVTACFESHDSQLRQITGDDCYSCHQGTFAEPGAQQTHAGFAAPGGTPPTTCGDCHDTSSWQPALGGLHPAPFTFTYTDAAGIVKNDTFLLANSPHDNIKCLACHDLSLLPTTDPPARGFNANCTQCHPKTQVDGSHRDAVRTFPGVTYTYTGYNDADPTFCRACHPQGLAMGHGPGNPFRLPHGGRSSPARCVDCHDVASGRPDEGGANVRCMNGCHNGSDRGNRHCNDPGHKPNCLNAGCHPDGRKHDGEEHCPAASGT